MNSWMERTRRRLLETGSPVLLVADNEWGVKRVVASLRDPDQPLIHLDLDGADCSDSVSLGNAVSESVRRGLGAALFGLGLDVDYALRTLESFLPAIAPVTVALTNAEACTSLAERFLSFVAPPNRIIVHTCHPVEILLEGSTATVLDASWLGVTEEEALELFGGERDEDEIRQGVIAVEGALVALERQLGLRPDAVPLQNDGSFQGGATADAGATGVVDALIARRRWVEAFEFAVDYAPTRIDEVLDDAGNAYFEEGEFDRFWRYLSDVPRWMLRQEQGMYWLFNAALAVNKWRPMLPTVDHYLEHHEAPDLRALRAMAEVTEDSLRSASRAYAAKHSPDTARALAFVETFRGDRQAAMRLYRTAIELAERHARPRQLVAAAAGMAQTQLFEGNYELADHWGSWALQQYQHHGLREELLRLMVISTAAYPKLLNGSLKSARQFLETVHIGREMLGIPSLEAMVSTLGDLAVVEGRYEDAIVYYKMNVDASTSGTHAHLANDLVHGYLIAGDREAALSVAKRAGELAAMAQGHQLHVAQLSLGSVLVHTDWREGEAYLREALAGLARQPLGPFNAQAALHLARSLLRRGALPEARAVLEKNSQYLRELGDSGWRLLGGTGPEIAQLKALFRNDEPTWRMQFLGKRSLQGRDGEVQLSLRLAELIAVLASNAEGIRGEQLALALYGDRANPSTLKATVSRARRIVPIESLPYRITEPYVADFVKVMELLQEGKIQAALELYRGPLLPESEAPLIVELREHLEESLRQAVLASGDADAMIDLANQQGDDLELWEETRRFLAPNDPRRPLANARIRRIRRRWEDDGL